MRAVICAVVFVVALGVVDARAQTKSAGLPPDARLRLDVTQLVRADLRGVERPAFRIDTQTSTRSSQRSVPRTILGVIVGGTAGFFAGGYTGAWIEGDRCHCDDPGLKGAIIGSLSGAAAGAILGGLFLF